MAIEKLLTGNIGSQVKELMATEDIMLEAVRDLVKDEIKTYIRDKVEADQELRSLSMRSPFFSAYQLVESGAAIFSNELPLCLWDRPL